MGKVIQIEVPENVAKFIEKNTRLKEEIVKKIVEETIYDKIIKEEKYPKKSLISLFKKRTYC